MNKIAELTGRSALHVRGEDAENFLQNVVTSDITNLEAGAAAYAGLLTPQGKLLFDFLIVKQPDGFLIDCASSQQAQLQQRLTMYKLRSKVDITPLEGAKIYAAWGTDEPVGETVFADPRVPALGWRIVGKADTNTDEADYHAHRVALGVADTDQDIGSGEIFPHEGNLDQLGGVSFTKGCFIGQEVVSRMEHRGTARTRFVIAEADQLQSGAEVSGGSLRIGSIKSVAGHQALALIRLDRAGASLSKGEAITVDGEPIAIRVPDWATFDIPQASEGQT